MTGHRIKQCENCAFKEGSPERQSPDWWNEIVLGCCHSAFMCHQTMFLVSGDGTTESKFDPSRRPNGSPATLADHQMCAGFVKMFGEEIGINPATVERIEVA